ncbi:MAG TPA: hypothetical protein VHB97_17195 [Polyangia bacterium]|nr:hypothetical protein [Polyangia bacterium]
MRIDLPRRFTVMAESYYFFDAAPIAPHDGGVLAALAYAPRPWIVLDVGVDAGLVQSQRSLSVFAGATLLPVTLWRRTASPAP